MSTASINANTAQVLCSQPLPTVSPIAYVPVIGTLSSYFTDREITNRITELNGVTLRTPEHKNYYRQLVAIKIETSKSIVVHHLLSSALVVAGIATGYFRLSLVTIGVLSTLCYDISNAMPRISFGNQRLRDVDNTPADMPITPIA